MHYRGGLNTLLNPFSNVSHLTLIIEADYFCTNLGLPNYRVDSLRSDFLAWLCLKVTSKNVSSKTHLRTLILSLFVCREKEEQGDDSSKAHGSSMQV